MNTFTTRPVFYPIKQYHLFYILQDHMIAFQMCKLSTVVMCMALQNNLIPRNVTRAVIDPQSGASVLSRHLMEQKTHS